MTDREPIAPAGPCGPYQSRPRTTPTGETHTDAQLESVSRGDGLPMSVTLTLPHTRAMLPDPAAAVRAFLARLPADLPPFSPAPLCGVDSRCAAEVLAAARAAACPDLFVIHAPDALAGERVAADVARAAGGRVLILSPNPAAADRITERLSSVGVVRALAEDENPIRTSPVVSRLTSTALGPARVESLRHEARSAIERARAQLAALDRLEELGLRLAALEEDLSQLRLRRGRAEEEARAATDRETVARTVRSRAEQENPQPVWISDAEQLSSARQLKHAALAEVRQRHGESSARPGFFARLLGRSKPQSADSLEADRQVQSLADEISAIDARLAESQAAFEMQVGAEWERLVREKAAAQLAQTDQQVAELTSLCHQAQADVLAAWPFGTTVPPAADWVSIRAAADQVIENAFTQLGDLDAPEVCRRLLAAMRVVVGTPGSLHTDAVFEPASMEPPFSLLVLDRCEDLTEPDFIRLAKMAVRWVLVGDALGSTAYCQNGSQSRGGRNGRSVEAPFAVKLARMLDRQTWVVEAGRLKCRFIHADPGDRRRTTTEPLLDRPEFDLHFTTDAEGAPQLAGVSFPIAMTIAEAKSFLYHELGAVQLRTVGELRWEETPNEVSACWPAASCGEATWIELEAGVREKITGAGVAAFTAAVAFHRDAGWDREKAEVWLAERLTSESSCRVAAIPAEATR